MKNIRAVFLSATATVWVIAGLAMATEVWPRFKTALTFLAGQHWTAKSIISLIVFFILYFLFRSKERPRNTLYYAIALALSVILGGAAILGFYTWHFIS